MAADSIPDEISEKLGAAGWKRRRDLQWDASFEHDNRKLGLEVNYVAPPGWLYVYLHHLAGGEPVGYGTQLVLKCRDEFGEALDAIVAFQDEISFDNFKEHVRTLVRICPETYTVEGEDELVLVTDED